MCEAHIQQSRFRFHLIPLVVESWDQRDPDVEVFRSDGLGEIAEVFNDRTLFLVRVALVDCRVQGLDVDDEGVKDRGSPAEGLGRHVQAGLGGETPGGAEGPQGLIDEELSNMRVSTFQKRFSDYSAAEISEAFDFIKTLEPFPAREFGGADVQFIVPDVYVYKVDSDSPEIDDHFAVICEEKGLPVLKLSPLFLDIAKNKDNAAKESAFVNEQLKDAEWFLNGLSRRNQTLVKVTREIVRRQKAFFLGFATAPSPLRMSEIAQALDIHEATVSRITSGKYLQCSAGIFALRYFFTNAAVTKTESTNGSASVFSKEEVKNRIKQLIDEAEKSGKKLSDEKISKKLEEYGMSVARRTVSKYRAELKIQSSYDR